MHKGSDSMVSAVYPDHRLENPKLSILIAPLQRSPHHLRGEILNQTPWNTCITSQKNVTFG